MLLEAVVCLALNVYHEARGESLTGQEAVANVVLNRVDSSSFPDTICQVVLQGGETKNKCQFSWYCDGRSDKPLDKVDWSTAQTIANKVLKSSSDPTNGALYYHADSIEPYWVSSFEVSAIIGSHIFYK